MKLILLDLDFTLLKSDKTISPRSLQVLKKAQDAGIYIGFCTSRGSTNIAEYIELVHPDVVISNGGACIYHKSKLVHTESFSLEQTRILLEKIYEVCGQDCEITVDLEDRLLWNRKTNRSQQYGEAQFDDLKNIRFPALKICVQTEDENCAKAIASSVSNVDCLRFSDIPWYKFSSASATKGNAVKFLCSYLKIDVSETMAFGDDYSDISMLLSCGTGVAMENAIPAVKEIADAVTLSNDRDGVADYIEKNILNIKFNGTQTEKIIETERLYLREMNLHDADELVIVLSDPQAMKFYPHAFSREEVENWIKWNCYNYRRYGFGLWAVIHKETGNFIGDCGITMQKVDEDTFPEIGYHILPEWQHKGYAIEAARGCLEYAKMKNFPKVISYMKHDNLPSRNVAEKNGMKYVKSFKKKVMGQLVDDEVLYMIEFEKQE